MHLNQEIIDIIKEKTPSGINSVDLLTKIISIKKEGAYRRLRGEIPLSLDEVAQIATYLEISLDKLLHNKQNGLYVTSLIRMNGSDPINAYCKTMEQITESIKAIKINKTASVYSAMNLFPYSHLFNYPVLSRFRLFKFLHQFREETIFKKMSEVIMPDSVREIEKKFHHEIQQIPISYIWSKDLFSAFVADVRYFSEIGLISPVEVDSLKEECHAFLNELEQDILRGKMKSGCPFLVYLSNIYFDSNYIYLESSDFKACSINVFGINFYSSTEADLCAEMKEWIESLMKYSVLISESGVIERTDFFRQQRSFLYTI